MSYKLQKPFKEYDKYDFIVKYNHQQGLKLEETEKAFFALEKNEIMQNGEPIINPNYENEQQEKVRQEKITELKNKLDELDIKRIRAVCENEIKDEKTGQTWLEYYNTKVIEYRNQLSELQK